jgi:xylose isomerase
VAEALVAARVGELAVPTLTDQESPADLLAADTEFDPDAAAAGGMHYERLDQLAMEHLLGAR